MKRAAIGEHAWRYGVDEHLRIPCGVGRESDRSDHYSVVTPLKR